MSFKTGSKQKQSNALVYTLMKQWQCLVSASVICEACSTESCWKGPGTKWLSKNTLSDNSSQFSWLTQTRYHANSRVIILHGEITQPALERSHANTSLFFPLWFRLSVSDTWGLVSMEA